MRQILVVLFVIAICGTACKKFLSEPYYVGNPKYLNIFRVVGHFKGCDNMEYWVLDREYTGVYYITKDVPNQYKDYNRFFKAEWHPDEYPKKFRFCTDTTLVPYQIVLTEIIPLI